ncbi:hypothetical protein CC2G_008616 [Coprinopsis cinerea AmutBmut pab1-1]|nr:hypothetical protein CC2G_008616 [Coprinopsis cinerea AmutBmut pab1-1]
MSLWIHCTSSSRPFLNQGNNVPAPESTFQLRGRTQTTTSQSSSSPPAINGVGGPRASLSSRHRRSTGTLRLREVGMPRLNDDGRRILLELMEGHGLYPSRPQFYSLLDQVRAVGNPHYKRENIGNWFSWKRARLNEHEKVGKGDGRIEGKRHNTSSKIPESTQLRGLTDSQLAELAKGTPNPTDEAAEVWAQLIGAKRGAIDFYRLNTTVPSSAGEQTGAKFNAKMRADCLVPYHGLPTPTNSPVVSSPSPSLALLPSPEPSYNLKLSIPSPSAHLKVEPSMSLDDYLEGTSWTPPSPVTACLPLEEPLEEADAIAQAIVGAVREAMATTAPNSDAEAPIAGPCTIEEFRSLWDVFQPKLDNLTRVFAN